MEKPTEEEIKKAATSFATLCNTLTELAKLATQALEKELKEE